MRSILRLEAGSSGPGNLTNVNGTLFFTASGPATGSELWKSDGTASGTVLVKDLLPGSPSSGPTSLTSLNGKLLFIGFDGVTGNELWVSDGSTAGTVLVKDIFPGPLGGTLEPHLGAIPAMTALAHSVVFPASNGLTGLELWKSNGEGIGTIQVQEILPGPGSSTPQNFTQAANQVFFTADDGIHGRELWVIPLGALDVTLQEQIGQLILLLNDPALTSAKLPASLTVQLDNARKEVSAGNGQENLVPARAHLSNFINDLQRLADKGGLAPDKAKPLLEGAAAILEQIEGNHPVKRAGEPDDSGQEP